MLTGLLRWCLRRSSRCPMSTFVSRVSPMTGKTEWLEQDDNYDFQQEIARSAYADMLHDTERNQKYYSALKKTIAMMKGQGREVHVLDIGTGTGLLSMMAARCGADSVTACEAFKPVAACAKEIIAQNGFADKIRLIEKRSTEVTVGIDGDMSQRANLLVTEVFDTELIGEGAIRTFHHAHENLLQKDCFVVPSAANMYVQIVSSAFIRRWNQLQPIRIPGCADIVPPMEFSRCGGVPSLHDLQLNQINLKSSEFLTVPINVFRFDYSGKTPIEFSGRSEKFSEILNSGQTDAVFMWWDLEMDAEGKIILSCAPHWAHPDGSIKQWRDHWMQAIYYPSIPMKVSVGQQVKVISSHDEYSLWFDITDPASDTTSPSERPVCTCFAHITCGRSRLGMLNDPNRHDVYIKALKQSVTPESVCLCISDCCLLPLMAARLGAKMVYTLESKPLCRRMMASYVSHNKLDDRIKIIDKLPGEVTADDLDHQKITILIGEPYFQSSSVPWDNLYFWYAAGELTNLCTEDVLVLPCQLSIKCIAVEFKDLWKIRAEIGNCEGFNLEKFDKLIQSSSLRTDAYIEPHALWEYPGTALTEVIDIMTLDLAVIPTKRKKSEGNVKFNSSGICNGVAIWAEFGFNSGLTISTGATAPVQPGHVISWDKYSQQGVHLLRKLKCARVTGKEDLGCGHQMDNTKVSTLNYSMEFKTDIGEIDFNFVVK